MPPEAYALPRMRPFLVTVRARNTVLGLTSFLVVLVVGKTLNPTFTHYWGYQVAQIGLTAAAVIWVDVKYAPEGGFSSPTLVIAVLNTYADSFGTAGHFYDHYAPYDKITHFLGGAVLAAASGDVVLNLATRRVLTWSTERIMATAVAVAISLSVCWEAYEYLGDALFGSNRVDGWGDTRHDLLADAIGAIVASGMIVRRNYQTKGLRLGHFSADSDPVRRAIVADGQP